MLSRQETQALEGTLSYTQLIALPRHNPPMRARVPPPPCEMDTPLKFCQQYSCLGLDCACVRKKDDLDEIYSFPDKRLLDCQNLVVEKELVSLVLNLLYLLNTM